MRSTCPSTLKWDRQGRTGLASREERARRGAAAAAGALY
jgi:hypothetical protein